MMLPEVEINSRKFKVLPNKYALLFMVWYSRGSSMTLHRLSLITYLSSHIIRYYYDAPPIISRALLNDVSELIREGLLEPLSMNGRSAVRVTEEGRRVISKLYSMGGDYVVFGDYLIVRLRDLLSELMRVIVAYQDLSIPILLSIALREWSIRERGLVSNILRDLSFDLRSPCENRLG